MKKIKWRLLLVAFLAISFAFTNRTPHREDFHHFAFLYKTLDQQRYYVSYDLTNMGWIQGDQYDCTLIRTICTIIANPQNMHMDLTGKWFYANDVPGSGINTGGMFVFMGD